MARVVLTVAGAVIGSAFGMPWLGAMVGSAIGGYVDSKLFAPDDINISGPRLDDLKVQTSSYGRPLPILYGVARIAGNVIWSRSLKETATTDSSGGGGKGGGGSPDTNATSFSYSVTLAIAVCEGPIGGISRVWADSELLTDETLGVAVDHYNVYLGTEDQEPDPIIESFDGVGNVPAYRGTAYVVIKDFPLADFGNRIPNFSFEVQKPVPHPLEEKITAVTMIPGAGEYVYDTVVQTPSDLLNVLPPSILTNGNFDTDTDWVKETGWTISGGKAHFSGSGGKSIGQNIFSQALQVYLAYTVTITITDYVSGSIQLVVGGNAGTPLTSNGTFTQTLQCGYGLNPKFRIRSGNLGFVGAIDSVTLIQAGRATIPLSYSREPSTQPPVNMHNRQLRADSLVALDQLQATLPNVEWISLVVCWFATSTDAGDCVIVPKCEYPVIAYGLDVRPDSWRVGSYDRLNATVTLSISPGVKTYGGTPSDKSVIRLVSEMKDRGYKVLFYPLVFVDTITPQSKPWRGRIVPANTTDCEEWFDKTSGYKEFIEHYLNLTVDGVALKDNIDAFAIGSEYVGMTSFTESTGVYPAVDKFREVAAIAKGILPSGVRTLYAADWSEYHHTDGGWFNMDPLWADPNIDIVGIDAYFPLTPDLPQSEITYQKIYDGWTKDEGWDYYWDDARAIQTPFGSARYAWKNFPYWYNNPHTNPDFNLTDWTPAMKPLWFTEIGFPSVDGCSNQPNVFVDPDSVESFYPRGSLRRVDNDAQKLALEASIDYLNTLTSISGLATHKFIWTWDARPYPAYPERSDVWADAPLWQTGHWINGKHGGSLLGGIVADLLEKAGVTEYDVSELTDTVTGYSISTVMSARRAIETLARAYFFEMVESDGILKFRKRGQESVVTIPQDNLVPLSGDETIQNVLRITRTQELDLPKKLTLSYFAIRLDLEVRTQIVQRQTIGATDQVNLQWELSLYSEEALNIAARLLFDIWMQRNTYKFAIPPKYAYLEPLDVVTVSVGGVSHRLRITSTTMQRNGWQEVEATNDTADVYDYFTEVNEDNGDPTEGPSNPPSPIPATRLVLLDLPALPTDGTTDCYITMAVMSLGLEWRGAVVYRSDDGGETGGNTYIVIEPVATESVTGGCLTALGSGTSYVWDEANTVEVRVRGELSSTTELAVLNGANVAVLGEEIIQFQYAELIDTNTYRLSRLLRGRLGTEEFIDSHDIGDRFILLNNNNIRHATPLNFIGVMKFYKAVSVRASLLTTDDEQAFTYSGRALKPYSPVQIAGERDGDDLIISWVRRTRIGGEWKDGVDVPLSETTEQYEINILDGLDVVRTLTSTTPTVTYTAADQTTDFGSPQSSVDIVIYQMSETVGRGIAATATV
jgi:hypothetical protein